MVAWACGGYWCGLHAPSLPVGDGPDVRTSLVPVRPFVFPCTFLRPWVCFYHWGEGSAAAAAACYQTAGLFGVAAALSVAAAAARRALPPGAAALPR